MTDNPKLKGLEWPHVKESKTVLDSGYPDSNSKNFPDLAGESGFPCIGQFKPRFSESSPYALMPLPVQLIVRELRVTSQKDRTCRFLTGTFRILSGFT